MSPRCSAGFGGCLPGCFQRGMCISRGWGSSRGAAPNAARVEGEALSDIVDASSFSAKLANINPRRPRLHDRLILGSYVPPKEWDRPLADTVVLSPEDA